VEIARLVFAVAPIFTPNVAFHEKMRFIRDHQRICAPPVWPIRLFDRLDFTQ